MFGNNRKTIGVFVTQEYQEFQRDLTKGICTRAKEFGYNVAFFTNFLPYYDVYQYEIGERSIADLPDYADFDGIILLPDLWYSEQLLDKVRNNIDQYSKCPVVSVQKHFDEYYNVLMDEDSRLDEIIRHFIEDHGYEKINFLTGPKDNPVSIERLAAYQRILKEHNIPIEEGRIFYGDFWKTLPKEAVKLWLSDPDTYPEAIICANDYMAITVCSALAEIGISVPEDIAISGCDNISMAQDYTPSITSTGMPLFEMGVEAVNKIHKHNEGMMQEQNTYMDAVTKIRESCGCGHNVYRELKVKRGNRIVSQLDAREKDITRNAFMSIELTNVKTVEDLDQKLDSYINVIEGCTGFYMCLNNNWDLYNQDGQSDHYNTGRTTMEIGIRNGKRLEKEEFMKPDLLPSSFADSDPQFLLFNILHYQEVCFGYTAISFSQFEVYKPSYQGWLINIGNALENIRIHNELNRLVFKLEDMYIKDDLTDLYNRRALDILGKKYLKQCIEENSKIMVFTADMDKLKYINDNFGHANGDIAIKVIADALRTAAEDDEICIRIGGDEFVVIGMDYNMNKMNKFLKKFEDKINYFNNSACNFQVQVSSGWSIINPHPFITIEDCMVIADSKMYQQKSIKHANNLRG